MLDGMPRRIVCMWFPRLAAERVLRTGGIDAPFVLTLRQKGADRIYDLNLPASALGLHPGMSLADARAFCPDLVSHPARPDLDARFLGALRRWATRFAPWAGREGRDGLVLDVTGASHLHGGEAAMLQAMEAAARRAGLSLRLGLAGSRGAAWALAHHGTGTVLIAPGEEAGHMAPLPLDALRLEADTVTRLQRLGLYTIGDLMPLARAPLARRFGAELLQRLDQALGRSAEMISPEAEPPHYGIRLTLPEPIGLVEDVMAATERLLAALCDKLKAAEAGARCLVLSLDRVDRGHQQVTLRLAAPMRDPHRILPLFRRGIEAVDAGFGIDRMRLEAVQTEALAARQLTTHSAAAGRDRIDDLITRIGTRIGLENVQRFLPADSHIPERSFLILPAAHSQPETGTAPPRPRPLLLFAPEPVAGSGARPPERFRWRRMSFATGRATGPERIAPEWWLDTPGWQSGLRDYWQVETRQGRRLWMFHTPQSPGWYVQGEFA